MKPYDELMKIASFLINEPEHKAKKYLQDINLDYRVVSRDGRSYVITSDFVIERFNLTIVENKVTGVTLG